MKKNILILAAICIFFASCDTKPSNPETDLAKYVNPMVGTDLAGNTFPGVLTPFGMVQLSPDTKLDGWHGCSGYHYLDTAIYGFSHTHLSGTGCLDYSDVLLMPFVGQSSVLNTEYQSAFSHKNEKAEAGYYSVLLDKHKIKVELTAAKRLGVHRYTFPDSNNEPKGVLLDLKHRDRVLASKIIFDTKTQTLTGIRNSRMWNENQQLSYAIVFSQPIEHVDFFHDDALVEPEFLNDRIVLDGTNLKAQIFFKNDIKEVVAKVAVSGNAQPEYDAALKNLKSYDEFAFDFERFRNDAREEWNRELGKIVVETKDTEKKKVFYTAMYHAFTAPYLFTDVDGKYLGRDGKIHQTDGKHEVYTVFSLWDTYRALHPLLNLIDRKRSSDFLYTFLKQYEQGGALPIWELSAGETNCMIGYHSVPVIYDAFVKGLNDYDNAKMLEAMVASAKKQWRGLPAFAKYGFIPADIQGESVSQTLEYAYDDWCIAQYAKAIGNEAIYREFNERCQFYKNILDPDGFMHAKVNGAFVEPFDPYEVNNSLTEANTWHYTTYVPHDADNFIALLGGNGAAEKLFDSLFQTTSDMTGKKLDDITGLIGQYAHGNEPSHHAVYWYNFVGKQWKTAELVRKITGEFYTSQPDGLCGNEDCGQMSAWYLCSSIGFYPFCPGTNAYLLGSPSFDRITVKLENGKQFVISCKNQSDKNIYIQSATLNGNDYRKSYFTYDDMKDGGELCLTMSNKANPDFGQAVENRPHTKVENTVTAVPYFSASNKTFAGEMTLSISLFQPKNADAGNSYAYPAQTDAIYYTLDGSVPTKESKRYSEPLKFTSETLIKASAYNEKTGYSRAVEARYAPYLKDKDILSQTPCNPMYNGGGEDGLIDCLRGNAVFTLGCWRGYEGKDAEIVIDLRETKSIKEIGAGFLQDVGPWIVFPSVVRFEISDDNKTYRPYGEVKAPCAPEDLRAQTYDYVVSKPAKARYVKVLAKCFGKLPDWHVGAGLDSHLFIDEVFVR